MLLIMALPQNVEFFTELIQNSVVIHQYFAITCRYYIKYYLYTADCEVDGNWYINHLDYFFRNVNVTSLP